MADFDLNETVALLERFPSALDALLRGLPDVWLDEREGEGTWSAREIVAHLIDSEQTNWIARIQIILGAGESKTFPAFSRDGHESVLAAQTIGALLDKFAQLRDANLAELKAIHLQSADLARTGIHPKFGVVTLGNLLATWSAHDLTHLHQLSRVLADRYRDAVGPWTAFLGVMRCAAHGD